MPHLGVAATRWKFSCSTSAEWQRGSSAASIYGANQARETQFYYAGLGRTRASILQIKGTILTGKPWGFKNRKNWEKLLQVFFHQTGPSNYPATNTWKPCLDQAADPEVIPPCDCSTPSQAADMRNMHHSRPCKTPHGKSFC